MKTGFKTLDNLPEKHLKKIASVSDERSSGNGMWIYLEDGYFNYYTETHNVHEETLTRCISVLKSEVKEKKRG